MPDDRNLFDDDSPPAQPPGETPQDTEGEAPPGGAAPWQRFASATPARPGDAAPVPPPWQQAAGAAAPPPGEADRPTRPEDAEWLSAFGQAAGFDESALPEPGDLDWLDAGEPQGAPDQPIPDWLAQAAGADESAPQPEAAEEALPDWLEAEFDEAAPGQAAGPASPDEAPLPDWLVEEPAGPPPLIRRIAAPEAEPAAEEEGALPAWMAEAPAETEPAEGDISGLTYEEWERRQAERERAAQSAPQDELLQEVPDWFKELDEQGPPPPPPAGPEEPEFVPGWFLGLEDRGQEEAPDWVQKLDLSAGPLAAPPEAAPPPEAPAAEPALPDWLTGLDLPAGMGAEWAPSAGQPAPAEPGLPSMLTPEELPFPDLDFDQGLAGSEPSGAAPPPEDFVERFEPIEPEEFAELPAADAESPGWLHDLTGEGAALPADEALARDLFEDELPREAARASAADDQLDWLAAITPGDVLPEDALEPPPFMTESAPPPAGESFEAAPLDSAALDELLGAYEPQPGEPVERVREPAAGAAPEAELFDIIGVPAPDVPAAEETLPDLGALQAEAPPSRDVVDLDMLFDDAALDEALSDLAAAPPVPSGEERAPAAPFAPESRAEPQPEWVEELRPPDLPVTVKAGGVEASVRQKQLAELPERLRAFRETALRELRQPETHVPPESGTLAGIPGALAAADIVLPRRVAARPVERLVITEQQKRRVAKLQEVLDLAAAPEEEEAAPDWSALGEEERLAAEAVAPAPAPRRARRRRRLKLDRVIVALLLLGGLIAPFATDALHLGSDPPALGEGRQDVASAVDALEAGDYVLFAFEYGPTAAGELDPLAEAVLRDVLARRAIPLVTGTDAAGVFHARAVIRPLADDARLLGARGEETALTAGEDYVLLGYLPGEAVGVRALSREFAQASGIAALFPPFKTDIRGEATGLPITSLARDIALIVVVGEDSGAVRMWAEQLQDVTVPKVALVTAAIEALTAPYVRAGGYAGYLAGVRDTYSYNTTRNADARAPYTPPEDLPVSLPDLETARWHSMALGAVVAGGVIALGTVLNLVRALTRRRRR